MSSEKTWKTLDTPEEINGAIERAMKAMKGGEKKLTRPNVAKQAAIYLRGAKGLADRVLRDMENDPQQLRRLLEFGYYPKAERASSKAGSAQSRSASAGRRGK